MVLLLLFIRYRRLRTEICKRLGVLEAVGKSRKARLAILILMGRILTQGSRLHMVKSWSEDEAIEEVLNIKHFDEDDLYETPAYRQAGWIG